MSNAEYYLQKIFLRKRHKMQFVFYNKKFNSKNDAISYYRHLLHALPEGVPLGYRISKELIELTKINPQFFEKNCGKHAMNIDYFYIGKNRLRNKQFYLHSINGDDIGISIKDMLDFASNAPMYHEKRKSLRKFKTACREAVLPYRPELKHGYTAHHANEGGFAKIVSDFISEFNINVPSLEYDIIKNGVYSFKSNKIRRQFIKFHEKRVKWQIITYEEHAHIHNILNQED